MGTPFDKTPRKTKTPQQRAEFFASRHGICTNCGRIITAAIKWAIDHIQSLENGGTNDDENLQLLCEFCHSAKTPDDRKEAATNRRKYTKHVVPNSYTPPKQKLRSRGFQGSRKFNGDVVIYREIKE